MYPQGTRLYISQGTIINLRSSPEIKSDNFKAVGMAGDPAKGKYIGNYKGNVKGKDGRTWIELDYPKFKWIDSGLVTNQVEKSLPNDQVFALPGGVVAELFDSIQPGAKPVLKFSGYTQIGFVRSEVTTSTGVFLKVTAKGYTGGLLYVRRERVILGSIIKDRIKQAIINDHALVKSACLIQSKLIEDKKAGINTTAAQSQVNALMERYARRQRLWRELESKGEINLDSSPTGQLQTVYNRLKSKFGIGAINWLAVGIITAIVFTVASVISIAVYKSWFEEKPTTSSAIDLNKLEEFRKKYDAASTPDEKRKALEILQKTVNEYGEEEFEKGKDAAGKDGFLNNLGAGFGKAIILGTVGALIIYGINQK